MSEQATQMSEQEVMWKDGKGRLVPISAIKTEHQIEDGLVRTVAIKAAELSQLLTEFKSTVLEETEGFKDLLAGEYGIKRGGKKGNMTLTSYDQSLKLEIQNTDRIVFGPELEVAQQLIDECIKRWSVGANDHLKVIVQSAFETDRKGNLSVAKIMGLRKHDLDDPDWRKAMGAIADAIRPYETATYVRVYQRNERTGAFEPITLDLAKA
ncbi:DUF3164 family protein [Polycladidibacter stylochi]|uniref:DUF3164 family protein n=1 Tax=Polycladidibacter stylochi TaxID=1807766 RepID=UPI00082E3F0F|nr:DUF3164 family protein [Pseudovibrio stylochi]